MNETFRQSLFRNPGPDRAWKFLGDPGTHRVSSATSASVGCRGRRRPCTSLPVPRAPFDHRRARPPGLPASLLGCRPSGGESGPDVALFNVSTADACWTQWAPAGRCSRALWRHAHPSVGRRALRAAVVPGNPAHARSRSARLGPARRAGTDGGRGRHDCLLGIAAELPAAAAPRMLANLLYGVRPGARSAVVAVVLAAARLRVRAAGAGRRVEPSRGAADQ